MYQLSYGILSGDHLLFTFYTVLSTLSPQNISGGLRL